VGKVVRVLLGVAALAVAVTVLLYLLLPDQGIGQAWNVVALSAPIAAWLTLCSLVIINVVLGGRRDDEASVGIARWGAISLAIGLLPLAALAALSTGRAAYHHGLMPYVLWDALLTLGACAYAIAYGIALLRGGTDWGERVRQINPKLAVLFGVAAGAVAVLLALLPAVSRS
jgi:hypothetical protein